MPISGKPVTDFNADSEAAAAIARAKRGRVPVGGVDMPAMPRLDQVVSNKHQGVQSSSAAAQRVLTPEQQLALQQQMRQPVANPTNEKGEEVPIDPKLLPRTPGSGLRPETIQQLEAVSSANQKKVDEDLTTINQEIDEIDEVYETNEFGERVRSLLGNKKRKELIENRCPPMKFEDLLLNGSVQQKVPIIPGRFEPTFRSLQGDEDLEIKRMMGKVRGPDQYIFDLFLVYQLTAGTYSINGKLLPDHLDKNGDFNEDLFLAKYKRMIKMGMPILADLSANFQWFLRRVQKLTVIDEIKGF